MKDKVKPGNGGKILFFAILAVEFAAGYYVCHTSKILMEDALSRVANAFYVLYISPPHLASIGFVWTPLPSFLELPLLLLWPFYQPIASSGLAGVVVTALSAAGTAALIFNNSRRFGLPSWIALSIVLLYCFNPFTFIYGFNGMSESIFIFCIVLAVTQLTQWFDDGIPFHLFWVAIAMALGFLTRYETIPFAIAVFISIAFISAARKRSRNTGNSRYAFFEGTAVVIFFPLAVAVGLWILANYVIMGDPLYFLRSIYSNTAITQYFQSPFAGNPAAVAVYVVKESGVFTLLLAPILLIRFFGKRLFQWETLILLIFILAIPVMHSWLLYKGDSYGWLRFFVYPLPILVAWLPYEIACIKTSKTAWKTLAGVFSCLVLLAGAVATGFLLTKPAYAPQEYAAYIAKSNDFQSKRDVADYINQNIPHKTLLLDSSRTGYIILNLDSTQNVITDTNPKFKEDLLEPAANHIEYILVAAPKEGENPDLVNIQYPGLYADGTAWCTLEKAFDGFKLYKVN